MWYGFWSTYHIWSHESFIVNLSVFNRWLLLRFDGLGALSILVITLFVLAEYVSGSWAGITITSAMRSTVSIYWTCRLAHSWNLTSSE